MSTTFTNATGAVTWVDSVNGSDSRGVRGSFTTRFQTIGAAITASLAGDVVQVFPGIYNEILTMAPGVSVIGVDPINCILSRSPSGNETSITMATNLNFANFTINLQPSGGATTGIAFTGTSNASSGLKNIIIVANSTSTGVVNLVVDSGTGVANPRHNILAINCQLVTATTSANFGTGYSKTGTGTSAIANTVISGGVGANVSSGTTYFCGCELEGLVTTGLTNSATVFADSGCTFSSYTNTGTFNILNPTGPLNISAQVAFSGVITPVILATSQDNYSPTDAITGALAANAETIRVSSTTSVNINGLAGGFQGRLLTLINVGNYPVILKNQSLTSIAANRLLLTGGSTTMNQNSVVTLIYDGISSRWRVWNSSGGAGSPGGLIQNQWVEVATPQATSSPGWPSQNPTTLRTAVTLPVASIPVTSTVGFDASGTLNIFTTGNGPQTVTYTSVTGGPTPTFEGCVGGVGAVAVGNLAYQVAPVPAITDTTGGGILPTGTLNVTSTAGFSASGQININTTLGSQIITYSGTTGSSFTGCTGGFGSFVSGSYVNAATLQDLLTIVINSSGGPLIIQFFASVEAPSNKTSSFRILIDGIVKRGSETISNGGAAPTNTSVSLKVSDLLPGTHTITVQWYSTGNAAIDPTSSESQNASLLVQEVSS